MKESPLKKLRVVVALVCFGLTVLVFLGFHAVTPPAVSEPVVYLQFLPSLVKYINMATLTAAGFLLVLLITLLFGRVFCSTVCPLGTLQDIIIHLAERVKRPRRVRFRYKKPRNMLRYGVLLMTAIIFLQGSLLAVNLLDPFSNFGRLFADLLRPVYIGFSNLAAHTLELFDSYAIRPLTWNPPAPVTLLFPLLFLAVLSWLSANKGRLFCNTLCPVGSLLGLVAKFAVFKITIAKDACTLCGDCSINCKAHCIRLKTQAVDFSRCIACFNCISVCPEMGIGYKSRPPSSQSPVARQGKSISPHPATRRDHPQGVTDASKRAFIGKSFLYLAGLTGLIQAIQARDKLPVLNDQNPVTPPGSQSIDHFTHTCTACHLCVSACPTQVLQPAFLEYGLSGMLQPRMDYQLSFCNFECTLCSQLCPTGAILPLSKETKQTTQLGIAKFLNEKCIVYTDQTACGACAEHCPTKAVQMIPYQNNLTIPEVRETICIGCGACEYACPVRPQRAIYVAGHLLHLAAQPPEMKPLKVDIRKDFPF